MKGVSQNPQSIVWRPWTVDKMYHQLEVKTKFYFYELLSLNKYNIL